MNVLDQLIPRATQADGSPKILYATVVSATPLSIMLDGDTEPLDIIPSATVYGIVTGDKVTCILQNNELIVTGIIDGDINYVQTFTDGISAAQLAALNAATDAATASIAASVASAKATVAEARAVTADEKAATADAKAVTAAELAATADARAATALADAATADTKAATALTNAATADAKAVTATTNAATADAKAATAITNAATADANAAAAALAANAATASAAAAVEAAALAADAAATADAKAVGAMASADGTTTTFRSPTRPPITDRIVGDTWFNEAEGNAIYTWDGADWVRAQLGTDALAVGSITAQSGIIASLDANVITGGTITSEVSVTGGLVIKDTLGASKTILAPGASVFAGDATLSSVEATDLKMLSTVELATGASLTLAQAVTAPTLPATVTQYWDSLTLKDAAGVAVAPFGADRDAATGDWITVSGTSTFTFLRHNPDGTFKSQIGSFNLSDLSLPGPRAKTFGGYGLAWVDGRAWAWMKYSTADAGGVSLNLVSNQSDVRTVMTYGAGYDLYGHGLAGHSTGKALIHYGVGNPNPVLANSHIVCGYSITGGYTTTPNYGYADRALALGSSEPVRESAFDFGTTRLAVSDGSWVRVWAAGAAGLTVSPSYNDGFILASAIGKHVGLGYYGSKIWTVTEQGVAFFYDGPRMTSQGEGGLYSPSVRYTWRDNNAAGGIHETALSPVRYTTLKPRGRWRITIPEWSAGAGLDPINAATIYTRTWAGTDYEQGTLTGGARVLDITGDFLTATAYGTRDPFPTGSQSIIHNADSSLEIKSDGSIKGASLEITGTVTAPDLQVALPPVGSLLPFAGTALPTGWLWCSGDSFDPVLYPRLFAAIGTTYGGTAGAPLLPDLRGRVVVMQSADTEFTSLNQKGGEKAHTLTSTEMPSHTHTQNAHDHTGIGHTHGQDAHSHTINHDHGSASSGGASWGGSTANNASVYGGGTGGNRNVAYATGTAYAQTMYPNNIPHTHAVAVPAYYGSSGAATATTQWTAAGVNANTATNQNTGGGGAHNNLQPYITLNYIIQAA